MEILGEPEGIEQLGGIDFDEAVFDHVRRAGGFSLDAMDAEDANALAALGQLRDGCTAAKEALSWDTDTAIAVALPASRAAFGSPVASSRLPSGRRCRRRSR